MSMTVEAMFQDYFGEPSTHTQALQRHASRRKLYRVQSEAHTAIGVCHDDVAENTLFMDLSRRFRRGGLPVPEMYCAAADGASYLEEDLGPETLFEQLQRLRSDRDRFPGEVEAHYAEALRLLPRFQVLGGALLDPGGLPYDATSMHADLQYFRRSFLARFDITDDLEPDFDHLVEHLMTADSSHFMYRDFQARNIMVRPGQAPALAFIDYQGGRPGPLQYDVVSLLYQTRSEVPPEARMRLLADYLDALSEYIPVQREQFLSYVPGFVILRLLQTLGTYGKVGLGERHPDFMTVIPRTVRALLEQLGTGLSMRLDGIRRALEGLSDRVLMYA